MNPDVVAQSELELPRFDVEALGGVLGSISIICWVLVFTPQIIENVHQRSTADLSLTFIAIWLVGDLSNVLSSCLQGVIPTMIILAVFLSAADVVLLAQYFYYRRIQLSDAPALPKDSDEHAILDGDEQEPVNGMANGQATVLDIQNESEEEEQEQEQEQGQGQGQQRHNQPPSSLTVTPSRRRAHTFPSPSDADVGRRRSSVSFLDRLNAIDGIHLNPAAPAPQEVQIAETVTELPVTKTEERVSMLWSSLIRVTSFVVLFLAALIGWSLAAKAPRSPYQRFGDEGMPQPSKPLEEYKHATLKDQYPFSPAGQFFGYLCALFYIGNRFPQLLQNYRSKSTEGMPATVFTLACVGNLTYILSILAYEPPCSRWDTNISPKTGRPVGYQDPCRLGERQAQYDHYIAVNLSWLMGSAGTIILDLAIFVQMWMYRGRAPNEGTIRIRTVPNSPVDPPGQEYHDDDGGDDDEGNDEGSSNNLR